MYTEENTVKNIFTCLFIMLALLVALKIPVQAVLRNPIFYPDISKNFSFKNKDLKIYQSDGFTISNHSGLNIISPAPEKKESDLLDLFLGFNGNDQLNNYSIISTKYETNNLEKFHGSASAKFVSRTDSIILLPEKNSILQNNTSSLQSFMIEFSLYPYRMDEGSQTIACYTSSVKNPNLNSETYGLKITIEGGTIYYHFLNFFKDKDGVFYSFTLQEQHSLINQLWETHSITVDSRSQMIKIYRNGIENDVKIITKNGTPFGETLFLTEPNNEYDSIPLIIGKNALFSLDEFSIYKDIQTNFLNSNPMISFDTEVFEISSNISWIDNMSVDVEASENAHYRLAYRFSPDYFFPNTSTDKIPWVYIDLSRQKFPSSQSMGKYLQWRFEYYCHTNYKKKPFYLKDIAVEFRENSIPETPSLTGLKEGDGFIEIFWTFIPDSKIESYEIYYGYSPENYFGNSDVSPVSPIQIPAPVSEEYCLSYKLEGLQNERPYYISIRAKDIYGTHSTFSEELNAIPSSIKNDPGFNIGR